MSRRAPNPAAEKAAKNQATIRNLLKLETNKICADCKRNKHPRWASWNLGVFICIRCSGIHRGMGTHISRVKSVDLDSWTDEQLQSILSWGNARANKYWEAKLAAGHAPSEAKIENFIRTKYELKRWVMDGGIPDPRTLDTGDDDVPLSLVRDQQVAQRKEAERKASVGKSAKPATIPKPEPDLIGGDSIAPRAAPAGPAASRVAPKAEPAPPKTTSTKDSLLGLDFFGDQPSAPARPVSTSTTGTSTGQSRPDLKQSILSLYATAPKPQPPAQPMGGGFGGMPSSPPPAQQSQPAIGGLNDAFSNLGFGGPTSPKPPAADPFASFGAPISNNRPTPSNDAFSGLGGGGFFDTKPSLPQATSQKSQPSSGGFGGLGSLSSIPLANPTTQISTSAMGDLFDLSAPPPAIASPSQPPTTNPAPASRSVNSVFNLSQPSKAPEPVASKAAAAPSNAFASNNWSNADVWGNAWGATDTTASIPAPAPAPAPAPIQNKPQQATKAPAVQTTNDFGWGSSMGGTSSFANTSIVPGGSGGFAPAPKVAADEEFGGWTSSSATPAATTSTTTQAASFGASEDLFSNVWQ